MALDRIHQLWSQLEVLSFKQVSGLSMAAISELIPDLRQLKSVTLPERIKKDDTAQILSIRAHLSGRNPPAEISFANCNRFATCKIIQPT